MKQLALVLGLLYCQACAAASVQAQGQGLDYARAVNDAQVNAIRLHRGSYIDQRIAIDNGKLSQQSLEHFRANIIRQRVISHRITDGIHHVELQVELADMPAQAGYQSSDGNEVSVDTASVDALIKDRGPDNVQTLDQILNDPNKFIYKLDEVKIMSRDAQGNVIVNLHYQVHWNKNYIDRLRSTAGLANANVTKKIPGKTALTDLASTVGLVVAKNDRLAVNAVGIVLKSAGTSAQSNDYLNRIKLCFAPNNDWNDVDRVPTECVDLVYDWRNMPWPKDTCREGEGEAFLRFQQRCHMLAFDFVKDNDSVHTVYYSLKINDHEPKRDGRVNQYYHVGHQMLKHYPGFWGKSLQADRETIVINYQQKQTIITTLALKPHEIQALSKVKIRAVAVDQ